MEDEFDIFSAVRELNESFVFGSSKYVSMAGGWVQDGAVRTCRNTPT